MRSRNVSRAGFTLLELLVVVVILAGLAALVIPRFDFARDQTDAATSASTMADLMTNLQAYKTVNGHYPDNFDSLLNASGATTAGLWTHPGDTLFTAFDVGDSANAGYNTSLVHAGVYTLWDIDDDAVDPNAVVAAPRMLVGAPGAKNVATVTHAAGVPTGSFNARIVNAIYPADGVIPTGTELVCVGIGSKCDLIGSTLTSAPIHMANSPATYYTRFIAVFAASADGTTAKLMTVIDSRRGTIANRLSDFTGATPN